MTSTIKVSEPTVMHNELLHEFSVTETRSSPSDREFVDLLCTWLKPDSCVTIKALHHNNANPPHTTFVFTFLRRNTQILYPALPVGYVACFPDVDNIAVYRASYSDVHGVSEDKTRL